MCGGVVGRAVAERLDGFQQKHRWAGFPPAVLYKYVDDFGTYLAALLTYYGFVSLFPLLLLISTVLGLSWPVMPSCSTRYSPRRCTSFR
jgi:hypothetical protein